MPFTRAEADRIKLSVTYCDDRGNCTVHRGGTRAWRNNNPGNIIWKGGFARRHGAIGDHGTFAIFPDPETGRRAMEHLLRAPGYKRLTVGDAIKKRAIGNRALGPGQQAGLKTYRERMERWSGVSLDQPMGSLTQQQFRRLRKAMERQEGIKSGTVKRLPPGL